MKDQRIWWSHMKKKKKTVNLCASLKHKYNYVGVKYIFVAYKGLGSIPDGSLMSSKRKRHGTGTWEMGNGRKSV